MKRIFFIFFIINLLNVSGQDLDSLKAVAAKLPNDTSRVNLFYNEGFLHRAIDAQYSYDCAKEAENYAQKAGLPFYAAKASNLLGILFYRKGDLNSALRYHKTALKLRTLINDKKGLALSETNLGNIYSDLGRYKLAEEAYLKALEINNELHLAKQIDNCLLNLGVLSTELQMINVAENYFNRALKNSEKRFDYEIEASCLNNLAVINTIKRDFDAAIANSLNSIKIKGLMENEMEMADSYLNIAVAYIKKKEAVPALENLLIADSIILKFNYLGAKVQSLKAWSEYYELEHNYEKGFEQLQKCNSLKDSLAKATKQIGEADFVESPVNLSLVENEPNTFPFLYFNFLIIILIACAVFIFRHKR
ncbi:MAG: tetratricopeptide repeat protein [Bacteroidetes bacterium]|nr:tetratricopeptide repeat protein [Bacteroidota bacterium]